MLRDILPPYDSAGATDILNTGTGTAPHPTMPTSPPRAPSPDLLDDVFGSAPASPTHFRHNEAGAEQVSGTARAHAADDPSDIPRLRSTHVTNGYREGIAVSKEAHMQEGFDEGYSLGAELGMKAGWCLGALEGIAHALPAVGGGGGAEGAVGVGERSREEVVGVREEAEGELKVQALFGEEFFGGDGIWRYEVPGRESEGEVTFGVVAEAHPLIGKWKGRVRALADELGLAIS